VSVAFDDRHLGGKTGDSRRKRRGEISLNEEEKDAGREQRRRGDRGRRDEEGALHLR
jgi:hypothetical protein